jgi:predicted ATPase
LNLGPLSFQATVETIELATEDDPLHPHAIDEIAGRSGGNPLFLFELIDAVRETGSVESLPDSVEALIAGEIDRLAPSDRTILRYAAVLGSSFEPELLVDSVREDVELDDGVWSRLADVLESEPSGQLRFRNTLIRDAAYEGLPYRRRRALHERVGMTIEARAGTSLDEEIGVLALHYFEAQRWDKAWTFCRQAGDRAMAIYANLEATRFYEKALVAGRRQRGVSSDELAALHELSSDALYRLGEFSGADAALHAARRAVRADPIRSSALASKQAMVSSRTGRYRQALVRVRRALVSLEGVRGREAAAHRARLMVTYAGVRYLQAQRNDSIQWSRRAAREARRGGAKDALAQSYKFLDLSLTENGEIEKARYGAQALAIFEELDDLRNQALMLNNLGGIAYWRSRWDESLELYERSLALFERIGDRTTASLAKFNISEIQQDQGRYDEAETLLRDAMRVWRASGAELDLAAAKAELGSLLTRRGDFENARDLLEAARAEQERVGNQSDVLATDARIAETLVFERDGASALKLIDESAIRANVTEGGSVVAPVLQRLRAIALSQLGRSAEAEAAIRDALESARARRDTHETALLLQALVALGSAAGTDVGDVDRERAQLFESLGIIDAPAVPLGPVPTALLS